MSSIDKLIINSPYEEPLRYWSYIREEKRFELVEGQRRPAGYVVATPNAQTHDDPGIFIPIELPNLIRPRVKQWRSEGYPGTTGITKRLLEHWNDKEQRPHRAFFFCQLEAIETLIFLTEAPEAFKTGLVIKGDGGEFTRLCSKMATGSGKTLVMGMLIAWQVLNAVSNEKRFQYSKNIFIVAPGLTVKKRLAVLNPSNPEGSIYEEFNMIPNGMMDKLRQGKILIHNWHILNWETEEQLKKKRSVDKRGAKSDEAYTREVLGDMAAAKNIVVINDEAHHAWRVPAESKIKGVKKEEIEEATKWIGGLDRIHRARGILTCYDFSATPFAPTGKRTTEEALFSWIVSDFGLNDAIESGLVKTPRVVIRTDAVPDATTYKDKLYHIYQHVADDLNREAKPTDPLPKLILNAYLLLGKDWLELKNAWEKNNSPTPPVMITVANRTESAARIKNAFVKKKVLIDELCEENKILHIDSKVLEFAEAQIEESDGELEPATQEEENSPERKLTKKEQAEKLRKTVDTVGKPGKAGAFIQNVISVGMLSEGWDAKTVTHIMGLRAFSSQLLCEQVVGRGLRRTTYDVDPETGMFVSEYVNIFGVPFSFLPHESQDGPATTTKQYWRIQVENAKRKYEIRWPNIVRIDHFFRPQLSLDMNKVSPLTLNADEIRTIVELAPVVEGKPDYSKIDHIKLDELAKKFRLQKIIFEAAGSIYEQMKDEWKGNKEYLLGQIVKIVEEFIYSDKIDIMPSLFNQNELRRRVLLALNMSTLVQHVSDAIKFNNTEEAVPVFSTERPIRSTGDMNAWYTTKPCEPIAKSHINMCVFDSGLEKSFVTILDNSPNVVAWAKNDHLGFEILYMFEGNIHKYRPDYIVKLSEEKYLIIEVKGEVTEQDKVKAQYLDEWVNCVNTQGGFGTWSWMMSNHSWEVEKKLVTMSG
jgi:type III restriction enzyme